jgi:hypothetical protein
MTAVDSNLIIYCWSQLSCSHRARLTAIAAEPTLSERREKAELSHSRSAAGVVAKTTSGRPLVRISVMGIPCAHMAPQAIEENH